MAAQANAIQLQTRSTTKSPIEETQTNGARSQLAWPHRHRQHPTLEAASAKEEAE